MVINPLTTNPLCGRVAHDHKILDFDDHKILDFDDHKLTKKEFTKMLKHKVRSLVEDRAPTKYPKSVVTVLHRIIDLTFVPDWRKSDAELCYSRPLPILQWAFKTNLEWSTTARAINILTQDGVIKENPQAEGSYAVVPTALQLLESKFRNTSAKKLERNVLKAVRMMLARQEEDAICQKVLGLANARRGSFEDSMYESNPERYAKQKALGRFEWDAAEVAPQFAYEHPAPTEEGALTCACVPPFCSHQNTI